MADSGRVEVYRCAAHGLIETTTPCSNGDGTTEHICPVLMGDGDSCGLLLDGPEPVVSLSDLQREIQTVRSQGPRRRSGSLSEELDGMYEGGYQAALLDLIDHLRGLGIDVERKD